MPLPKISIQWDDNGFFSLDGLTVSGYFSGSEGDLIGDELKELAALVNAYRNSIDASCDCAVCRGMRSLSSPPAEIVRMDESEWTRD